MALPYTALVRGVKVYQNGVQVPNTGRVAEIDLTDTDVTYSPANGRLTVGPGATFGAGTEVGQSLEWNGTIWVKRRNWITPDIDLTGVTDATAAIQAALGAAGASGRGGCVYLPEGKIRLESTITIPAGVSLVGPPRGLRRGSRLFADIDDGAQLEFRHTGIGVTMGIGALVENLAIYYPDQSKTGTPTVYDYAFDIPANSHGCTIRNVAAINPYRFVRVQDGHGFLIENVWGYPLSVGLNLGHVADVGFLRSVHFNPANDYQATSGLWDWVQANGTAFIIDGTQMLQGHGLHAFGYNLGIDFRDADSDIATYGRIVYGAVNGLNLESCNICIRVAEPNALGFFTFSDVYLVPRDGGSGTFGVGVRFEDTNVPATGAAGYPQRPTLNFSSLHSWSGATGSDRVIWFLEDSHGKCVVMGGDFHAFNNQGALVASPDAYLTLVGVSMPEGATRVTNSGSGTVEDLGDITVLHVT